jgi:hypothetical protein
MKNALSVYATPPWLGGSPALGIEKSLEQNCGRYAIHARFPILCVKTKRLQLRVRLVSGEPFVDEHDAFS